MRNRQLYAYLQHKPPVVLVGRPIDLRVLISIFGADTRVGDLVQALRGGAS